MCRRSGAAQVIIADFSDSRLEMALQVGATIAINSGRADLEQEVARLTAEKVWIKVLNVWAAKAAFCRRS